MSLEENDLHKGNATLEFCDELQMTAQYPVKLRLDIRVVSFANHPKILSTTPAFSLDSTSSRTISTTTVSIACLEPVSVYLEYTRVKSRKASIVCAADRSVEGE